MDNGKKDGMPGLDLAEQEWNEIVLKELEEASFRQKDEAQEKPAFVIDSDRKADWAVRRIAEEKREYDRLKELAEEQIARIEEKQEAAERRFSQHTAYLRSLLGDYFSRVPHQKTKTQETYRLLSGKLVMKLPKAKPVYEEGELLDYLRSSGMPEFIKTKEEVRWGEFKKLLDFTAGRHPFLKDTGELVECIRLEETPAEFKVEV